MVSDEASREHHSSGTFNSLFLCDRYFTCLSIFFDPVAVTVAVKLKVQGVPRPFLFLVNLFEQKERRTGNRVCEWMIKQKWAGLHEAWYLSL